MRIYLAYKFRNNADKDQLKKDLVEVANFLDSLGNETFILGRDVQDWGRHHISAVKNLMKMTTEIRKCDAVIAYITDDNVSVGLPYETINAKIMNKKIMYMLKEGLQNSESAKLCDEVLWFKDLEDLKVKLRDSGFLAK